MENKGFGSTEPISKKERHTLSTRLNKTKRSNQLCFLIGLLNMIYPFTIQRPRKKSQYSQQIFGVKTIELKHEIFDVESYLQQRCPLTCETNNKNERHKHGEQRILELFELLLALCSDMGLMVFTSKMRNKSDRNKIDFIDEIYFNKTLLFNASSINSIGEQISNELLNITSLEKKETMLNVKHQSIFNIFKASIPDHIHIFL